MSINNKLKVAVLYRVIQDWRAPVFERLANHDRIELVVLYGPDIKGTKAISSSKNWKFKKEKQFSFLLRYQGGYQTGGMPLSPFLFFRLIFINPNVVLSEGASNLFNAIQGFIYSKLFNKRFIWWSLGKLPNTNKSKKGKMMEPLVRFLEKNSSAVLTYSTQGANYFKSLGISENRIFIAVNTIDTSQIKSDLKKILVNRDKNKFVILYVGAILKSKNIDLLIRAFKTLKKTKKDLVLNIIGNGEFKNNLENIVKDEKIQDVNFLGRIVDGKEKYFLEANLFVLPGLGGLAISEAMAYGLPIICTHGDGCEKDLVDENNGLFIEKINEKSLHDAILQFYNNKQMTAKMGLKSKKKIEEQFGIEFYMNNLIKSLSNERD